jgi:hypothetical protein
MGWAITEFQPQMETLTVPLQRSLKVFLVLGGTSYLQEFPKELDNEIEMEFF